MSRGRIVSVRKPNTGPVSRPASSRNVEAPGHLVAGDDRVLHGGRAAPGGQHREVQVDPAVGRDVQQRRRDQGAVGDDRRRVDRELREPRLEVLVARALRSEDLEAGLQGARLDLARRRGSAAPRAGVRAREDRDHLVAGVEERLERRHRGRGSSGEEQSHGVDPRCAAARRRAPARSVRRASAVVNRTASNPAAAPAATFVAESSVNTVRSGRRPNRSRQQREDPWVGLRDPDLARDQHVLEQPDRGCRRLGEVERLRRPVGEARAAGHRPCAGRARARATPGPVRSACRRSAPRTGRAPAGARGRSRPGPPAHRPTNDRRPAGG